MARHLLMFTCLCTLLLMGVGASAHAQSDARALTHRTPDGLRVTVTDQGLSAIRAGERRIADGHWRLRSAEQLLGMSDQEPLTGEPAQRAITVHDDRRATVTHSYDRITVEYTYVFADEDVTITARVRNRGAQRALEAVAFGGLNFDFGDENPSGLYRVWSAEELGRVGAAACHPSKHTRIGGTAVIGDGIGVGAAPVRTSLTPALVNWRSGHDRARPSMTLQYIVPQKVWTESRRTFTLKLRFSTGDDWKHLLKPYKRTFKQTFGEARHDAIEGRVVHEVVPTSFKKRHGGNAYGYSDKNLRFDREATIERYVNKTLPLARQWGARTVIFTGLAGADPRGVGYRPAFSLIPPELSLLWPTLRSGFEARDMRLGVSGQPNAFDVRETWHTSSLLPVSAEHETQMKHIWTRHFKPLIKRGVNAYYFVNFGGDINDIRLARFYREKLGPETPVISEHCSDVLLLYTHGQNALNYIRKQDRFQASIDAPARAALNWLVPEATVYAHPGQNARHASHKQFADAARNLELTPMLSGAALRELHGEPDNDKAQNGEQ